MACEVWTRRVDASEDPGLMGWRAGLVVSAKPLGRTGGALDPVRSDTAYIWTIVDRDRDDVAPLLDSYEENGEPVALREWWIDYSKLPMGARLAAEATGRADLTYEQLRVATKSLVTGEPLGES